jgi:hypothetical protein
VAAPHLFRVILPVTDIEVAASFYARMLGMIFYGRDLFDNPICFVDSQTVFTGDRPFRRPS